MNVPQAKNILTAHMKHWTQHGLNHLNNKAIVKECFQKIMFHSNRALKALEEDPEPPPPPPPPPKPSKLAIKGKNIYFLNGGTILFKVKSVWRREILGRAIGYHGGLYGKKLEFFEDLLKEYKIPFIREDAIHDIDFLRDHLQRMYKEERVVELTLWDNEEREAEMGDPMEIIEQTKDFPNIIYDPVNELYSKKGVDIAKSLCGRIRLRGLISSAGAYGFGGQKWSKPFYLPESPNNIIGVHRGADDDGDYNSEHLEKFKKINKPFIRTEIHHKSVSEVERIMRDDFAMGSSIEGYYGLRCNKLFPDLTSDPDSWREYFKAVGN